MEPWRRLDEAAAADARELLRRCCGARAWVDRMLARRPFRDLETMVRAAREEWFALSPDDWLEAFRQHPRIGDRNALRQRFAATADLSEREQAGIATASDQVLSALADGNRAYEQKFGYIFIVCATGRSAADTLAALRSRMENSPEREILTAAEEQAKITELRLLGLK